MLGEHLLEGFTVDAALVEQRFSDLVAEDLLEAAILEPAAPQVPIGLRLLRRWQHLAALVPHEFVVYLAEPTRPGPAPRQCFTREVVVVDHIDVVVEMPACAVGVCDDEMIGAVHASSELHAEVVYTLDVLGILHVELLRGEVLCVRVHLVTAMERRAHLLRTPHDLLGRAHRAREHNSTCRAVLLVLRAALACAEQRVHDCCSCARRRLHVDSAHNATSSPSRERTSPTAARTSRRMSSSTALPARTT